MPNLYFISDAHIGGNSRDVEEVKQKKLCSFLDFLKDQDVSLFIVGDLFDFWFEYKYTIPSGYQKTLSKLFELRQRGIPIEYITGNHDFWMNNFFPDVLGVPVHHGTLEMEHEGRRFYIFHGDGIIKNDPGYRLLKRILQHPVTIALYRLIHPDFGIPLAHLASSMSRDHHHLDPEEERQEDQEYIKFAKGRFREGFDFVVLGHSHRPLRYQQGDHVYVNLGDWIRQFTFAKFDGKTLTLETWQG